jgi:hypothetical protein
MTKPTRTRLRHGLHGLMSKVSAKGLTALDQRSAGARALSEWRRELERDLGGAESLSAQQRTIVELACRVRVYLDHIDGWLMLQPSLINKRKRTVIPVVRERMQLSDSLARLLTQLGIERQTAPAPRLADFLEARAKEIEAKSELSESEPGVETESETQNLKSRSK